MSYVDKVDLAEYLARKSVEESSQNFKMSEEMKMDIFKKKFEYYKRILNEKEQD